MPNKSDMILSARQIKEAEQGAASDKTTLSRLMYNAGSALAKAVSDRLGIGGKKITVVCGSGNNGGDGLAAARELLKFGASVSICFPLGVPATETAKPFIGVINDVEILNGVPKECDILIDCLFGTGLNRQLEGKAKETVLAMNRCSAVKIATDIPSGVPADGEFIPETAFAADLTYTFIALKLCSVLPSTSEYFGETAVVDIGAPPLNYTCLTVEPPYLKKRPKNSHKGTFGTLLLFCGSYGMCGAQIFATSAAYASGVGMCRAFVCDKNYTAFCVSVPEAVTLPVPTLKSGTPDISEELIKEELRKSTAVLIGCGLGNNGDSQNIVKAVLLNLSVPAVLDADGINCVSKDINILKKAKAPLILTPHPKEMARLCGKTVREINDDRINCAKRFAEEYNCILVLKGANTVVASPSGEVFINTTGNPGMAVAGSGDVLSGIIASRLSQGDDPLSAALCGVYIHGLAGDKAADKIGETALVPQDIIKELKTCWGI